MVPNPAIHALAREREDKIREELRREERRLEWRSAGVHDLPAQQPKRHSRSNWQPTAMVRRIGSYLTTLSASRAED